MGFQEQTDNGVKLFVDPAYSNRIIDAFGVGVVKSIYNTNVPDETTGVLGTQTLTNGSTMVNSVTVGNLYTITTDTAEYDGVNWQEKGLGCELSTTKKLYFEAELELGDATQSDLFIGLATADTTLLNAAASHAIALGDDGVFFSKLDASTTLAAKTYLGGAETATANYGTALADATSFIVRIYWDRETVKFYVNNTLITCVTASLPNSPMTLSFNLRAGAAAAKTAEIHNWKVLQW